MKIGDSYVMAVVAVALCVVPSFGVRVRTTERGTRVSRQATSYQVKRNFKLGGTDKKRRKLGGSSKSAKSAKADIQMFEEIAARAKAASTGIMSSPETSQFRDRTSQALVRGAVQGQSISSQVESLSKKAIIATDFLITPQFQCDSFTTFADTWFNWDEDPKFLCLEFQWMNPYLCFEDVDLINTNQTIAEAYCASLFYDSSGAKIPLGGDYDNLDCFTYCNEFIGSNPIDPAIVNATLNYTQGHCCTKGYYPRGNSTAA
jgi:hypothetical protein